MITALLRLTLLACLATTSLLGHGLHALTGCAHDHACTAGAPRHAHAGDCDHTTKHQCPASRPATSPCDVDERRDEEPPAGSTAGEPHDASCCLICQFQAQGQLVAAPRDELVAKRFAAECVSPAAVLLPSRGYEPYRSRDPPRVQGQSA